MSINLKRVAPVLILGIAGAVAACGGGGRTPAAAVSIQVKRLQCTPSLVPASPTDTTRRIALECRITYTVDDDSTEKQTSTPNDTIYDPKT